MSDQTVLSSSTVFFSAALAVSPPKKNRRLVESCLTVSSKILDNSIPNDREEFAIFTSLY